MHSESIFFASLPMGNSILAASKRRCVLCHYIFIASVTTYQYSWTKIHCDIYLKKKIVSHNGNFFLLRFTAGRVTNLVFMDDGNFYLARETTTQTIVINPLQMHLRRIYRIIAYLPSVCWKSLWTEANGRLKSGKWKFGYVVWIRGTHAFRSISTANQ